MNDMLASALLHYLGWLASGIGLCISESHSNRLINYHVHGNCDGTQMYVHLDNDDDTNENISAHIVGRWLYTVVLSILLSFTYVTSCHRRQADFAKEA